MAIKRFPVSLHCLCCVSSHPIPLHASCSLEWLTASKQEHVRNANAVLFYCDLTDEEGDSLIGTVPTHIYKWVLKQGVEKVAKY